MQEFIYVLMKMLLLRFFWFLPSFLVMVKRCLSGIISNIELCLVRECFDLLVDCFFAFFDEDALGKSSSTSSKHLFSIAWDIFFEKYR